jgi:hypothetical protein
MNGFYETIDGKEKAWNPTKQEFEQYREVCLMTWGGMPLDVTWAMGTPIYRDREKLNWGIRMGLLDFLK